MGLFITARSGSLAEREGRCGRGDAALAAALNEAARPGRPRSREAGGSRAERAVRSAARGGLPGAPFPEEASWGRRAGVAGGAGLDLRRYGSVQR